MVSNLNAGAPGPSAVSLGASMSGEGSKASACQPAAVRPRTVGLPAGPAAASPGHLGAASHASSAVRVDRRPAFAASTAAGRLATAGGKRSAVGQPDAGRPLANRRAAEEGGAARCRREESPPPSESQVSLAASPVWCPLPPDPAVKELVCFCFQTLLAQLGRSRAPEYPAHTDPHFKAPLFVTWEKPGRTGHLELRGCIGCLEPVLFRSGLGEYARRSSIEDRRFPPVQLEEVASLRCKVSILYDFEELSDIFDWVVGEHGVQIHFYAQERYYSATYLPEVALEHGMTRERAIRELIAKAGYQGRASSELLAGLKVTRYRSLVQGLSYSQFLSAGNQSSDLSNISAPAEESQRW